MKDTLSKPRCECPEEGNAVYPEEDYLPEERIGMFHAPNECKCTNELKQYRRNGKLLWLCSCCFFLSDKEVTENLDT